MEQNTVVNVKVRNTDLAETVAMARAFNESGALDAGHLIDLALGWPQLHLAYAEAVEYCNDAGKLMAIPQPVYDFYAHKLLRVSKKQRRLANKYALIFNSMLNRLRGK